MHSSDDSCSEARNQIAVPSDSPRSKQAHLPFWLEQRWERLWPQLTFRSLQQPRMHHISMNTTHHPVSVRKAADVMLLLLRAHYRF
jgi:hypothetical protein